MSAREVEKGEWGKRRKWNNRGRVIERENKRDRQTNIKKKLTNRRPRMETRKQIKG